VSARPTNAGAPPGRRGPAAFSRAIVARPPFPGPSWPPPATLAAVTDAAAPRAADPDGPSPGQRAGDAESVHPVAGDPDLAHALVDVVFGEERLAAFDASIRAMAGVLAVDRVLQVIVDRVRELVGAGYAALGIVDGEGVIEQFITSGMSRLERSRIGPPPRGHGILGLIIREERSYRIADLMQDPRRHGFPPHHPDMHSFLGVPVTIRGRTIGNLYLTEKDGGFSEGDQQLVELFAGHAAIAMENARLHDQVQRLAIVEERERIGRDLHDGVIQSIYAVGLSLEDVPDLMVEEPAEASRRVERAIESLDQTIRDIRNFIFGLRPQLLDGVELVEGLAALADEFRVNTMVDVELRAGQEVDGIPLGPERTLEVLSVAREALSNIARHAKATRAEVLVATAGDDGGITLTIIDNGMGFDPDAPRGLGHLGLANMDARTTGIGGTLAIESSHDLGTRIIVHVPRDSSVGETEDGPEA
jgi:signal transduction histidine kinase